LTNTVAQKDEKKQNKREEADVALWGVCVVAKDLRTGETVSETENAAFQS